MAGGYLSEIFTSIQGEGPYVGLKQIFIRFTGCSLRCEFCDTKSTWQVSPHLTVINPEKYRLKHKYANPVTPDDTLKIIQEVVKKEPFVHSIFLTGGEPLEQPEYFQQLVLKLKKTGLKIYLETNTVNHKTLPKVIEDIDIISADVKILHPDFERKLKESLFDFLKLPFKNAMFLKIPVNSSLNLKLFQVTIEKISAIRNDFPIIIQPLTEELLPVPDLKFVKFLFDLQTLASSYFDEVRIIPQIHKFLKVK